MNISIIAAIGKNNELGKNNNLIWHLKGDLKFFKDTTAGHIIVMGRKTFESLPGVLPNRHHIVLSKSKDFPKEVEVFSSIEDFFEKYDSIEEEIFVIGGSFVYNKFIDSANKLYLTEIDAESEADVYFPEFNRKEWEKEEIDCGCDDGILYKHVLYRRIK